MSCWKNLMNLCVTIIYIIYFSPCWCQYKLVYISPNTPFALPSVAALVVLVVVVQGTSISLYWVRIQIWGVFSSVCIHWNGGVKTVRLVVGNFQEKDSNNNTIFNCIFYRLYLLELLVTTMIVVMIMIMMIIMMKNKNKALKYDDMFFTNYTSWFAIIMFSVLIIHYFWISNFLIV